MQYLGLETADENKNNTNYVVDPTSQDKSKASFKYPKETEEHWATDTYEDFYKTHNAGKNHTNSTGSKAAAPYNPETAYYILDYVKENTSFDNNEQYATGLVFKGKYYEAEDWDAAKKEPIAGHESKGKDKAYTYVIRHSDPTGNGTTDDIMHWNTVDEDEQGKIAHADFMTSRILKHEDYNLDGRLLIKNKETGNTVVNVDLPDLLSRLRTSEEYSYSAQEFLDRAYDYKLQFFIQGGKLKYCYITISVNVLSWSKRIQFEELH